jgi:hypothetical protein
VEFWRWLTMIASAPNSRALASESKIRQTTACRAEFGFKEDTNRISGRAKKDKRTE